MVSFDDFWAIYPRKSNKAQAKKAWAKANVDDTIFGLISENIQARLDGGEWDLEHKEYIPHASTYLNNERWEDEVIRKRKHRDLHQDLTDRSWASNIVEFKR